MQKDLSSYYVLSYVSSNSAQDGRYRRIQVKLAPRLTALKAKLDYRQGYFGPTPLRICAMWIRKPSFRRHLMADNPVTDLPLAVEVDYFRMEKNKYLAPISVKVPGSSLAFHSKGAKQATELDFIAEVFDARNRPAATVRDTIPLRLAEDVAGQVVRKSINMTRRLRLRPEITGCGLWPARTAKGRPEHLRLRL